jgi:phosphate transport system protein
VLESDDEVDQLRDWLYRRLILWMQSDGPAVPSAMHQLFVIRHLERIADHATNIGEDVLFYLRGVDVRHHAALAG